MIETFHLSHNYGSCLALKDISFSIQKGEVAGLLGLNGAGKTTCIKILCGFIRAASGRAAINGIDIDQDEMKVKGLVGYLPESPPLYPELTVKQYLTFIARMKGISGENEVKRAIDGTGLTRAENSFIHTLSLGYKKRTGIAQAILGSPPVLIFDEPISGLDPRQIVEIRNLIRDLSGNHTILISSHILTEISRTCDRVIILHEGCISSTVEKSQLNDLENLFLQATGGNYAA